MRERYCHPTKRSLISNLYEEKEIGKWRGIFDCGMLAQVTTYTASVDPGRAWLTMGWGGVGGTAILCPGQYMDAYEVGDKFLVLGLDLSSEELVGFALISGHQKLQAAKSFLMLGWVGTRLYDCNRASYSALISFWILWCPAMGCNYAMVVQRWVQVGLHNAKYEALLQRLPVKVWRDNDCDGKLDFGTDGV